MLEKEKLKITCDLFNQGTLKLQDAIVFGLNSYILNCKAGKVLNISKESEKET